MSFLSSSIIGVLVILVVSEESLCKNINKIDNRWLDYLFEAGGGVKTGKKFYYRYIRSIDSLSKQSSLATVSSGRDTPLRTEFFHIPSRFHLRLYVSINAHFQGKNASSQHVTV